MTSQQRLARAFLTSLDRPDDTTLAQLVVDHGVLATAEMVAAAGYRPLDWETQALRLLDRARRQHVRFVVPADEDWPAVVSRSSAASGPFGLWVRGDGEPAELLRRSVVVLGSRTATPYAAGLAFRLAGELSAAGWTVVTSGAVGVASAALRGALVGNRPAVAVPLGGALHPTPVVHTGCCAGSGTRGSWSAIRPAGPPSGAPTSPARSGSWPPPAPRLSWSSPTPAPSPRPSPSTPARPADRCSSSPGRSPRPGRPRCDPVAGCSTSSPPTPLTPTPARRRRTSRTS